MTKEPKTLMQYMNFQFPYRRGRLGLSSQQKRNIEDAFRAGLSRGKWIEREKGKGKIKILRAEIGALQDRVEQLKQWNGPQDPDHEDEIWSGLRG